MEGLIKEGLLYMDFIVCSTSSHTKIVFKIVPVGSFKVVDWFWFMVFNATFNNISVTCIS
jgi:hypothetical protein